MNDLALPVHTVETDRRKFLGGSDVAAIFGVSPWQTPFDLFIRKLTSEPEELTAEKRKFFARRKRQEPVVAEMLADEYGIAVTRLSLDGNPNRYVDREYPFLVAEIDFEFLMSDSVRAAFPDRPEFCAIQNGTLLNGEIKTVHPFKVYEWGEQGSEDVPIHYAAQVMHGLGVTGRPAAIVAALFGLDTLLAFPIVRDDETISAMRSKSVAFWTKNVMDGIPPDPVNIEDVQRMYAGFVGRPVDLSEEAHDALHGLDSLRVRKRGLEEESYEFEWRLARCIAMQWGKELAPDDKNRPVVKADENAVLTYQGRPVGSWNRQRGTYLDQKRLAGEKPEITRAYTIEHKYRVFRLKKEKR